MRAMSVAQQMTADEYLRLPEEHFPRGTQLIDGEVVMTEASLRHQLVVGEIYGRLWQWMRAGPGRGQVVLPLDVRLDDRNVFAPDILWYAEAHVPARDRGRPSPIPDLAVEVRSPSTWRRDVGVKKAVYEQQGLPELWLVDTVAERVLVLRRSSAQAATFESAIELGRGEALTSPLLAGFALAISELFED